MLDAEMDQEAGTALIKYVLLRYKYNKLRTIYGHGHGVIGAPSTLFGGAAIATASTVRRSERGNRRCDATRRRSAKARPCCSLAAADGAPFAVAAGRAGSCRNRRCSASTLAVVGPGGGAVYAAAAPSAAGGAEYVDPRRKGSPSAPSSPPESRRSYVHGTVIRMLKVLTECFR